MDKKRLVDYKLITHRNPKDEKYQLVDNLYVKLKSQFIKIFIRIDTGKERCRPYHKMFSIPLLNAI